MKRHWRAVILGLLAIVLVAAAAGWWWLNDLAGPMPEAEAALVSDDTVTVSTDPWLTFAPDDPSDTGFILYPGGRVSPESYAPAMHAIADAGHLAVTVPMPFGLAVLAPNAADEVIETFPDVDRWVIGGHSLGGAMAAGYAAGHDVDGLALWAAYPAQDVDLSDSDLTVSSIYASADGLATPDKIEDSMGRLPAETFYAEIVGGNHAQFGWYGPQDGDGEATITPQEQQDQVLDATLELLDSVAAG